MDTAIVAGLAGVAGATSFALITGYLQRAAHQQQAQLRRREQDLDEWRVLLDEAIDDLEAYIFALRGASARFAFSNSATITKEAFDQIFDPVIEAKQAPPRHARRMTLRLGRQSPILLAYRQAITLCDQAATELGTAVSMPGKVNPATDDRVRFSIRQDLAEERQRAAFDQFVDAGFAFVGDQGPAAPTNRRLPWHARTGKVASGPPAS